VGKFKIIFLKYCNLIGCVQILDARIRLPPGVPFPAIYQFSRPGHLTHTRPHTRLIW